MERHHLNRRHRNPIRPLWNPRERNNLVAVLWKVEQALSIQASYRMPDQARNQRALEALRGLLNSGWRP